MLYYGTRVHGNHAKPPNTNQNKQQKQLILIKFNKIALANF
jgi:hypothetical protein